MTGLILGIVGGVGVLGVALVAPGVLVAMSQMGFCPGSRQKEIINRARDRMVRQGLLARDGFKVRLTVKGKKMLERMHTRKTIGRSPRDWDGKWRILIFDIPEYRKGVRDKMRRMLHDIGFMRIQQSVWAYPYDCEDYVALLKADFKIGKDLLYLIVEEMEGSWGLRKHFGLVGSER